jgi:hypothetical protein
MRPAEVVGDLATMTTYLVNSGVVALFFEKRARSFPDYFDEDAYRPNTLLVVQRLVEPRLLMQILAGAIVEGQQCDGERPPTELVNRQPA